MCDIDHFKQINDNYGHQAGDEVIITFAADAEAMCRPGDLVARYGGEEFVMLCADCDNATAARRAETDPPLGWSTEAPVLGHKCITASFGVTEIQPAIPPKRCPALTVRSSGVTTGLFHIPGHRVACCQEARSSWIVSHSVKSADRRCVFLDLVVNATQDPVVVVGMHGVELDRSPAHLLRSTGISRVGQRISIVR